VCPPHYAPPHDAPPARSPARPPGGQTHGRGGPQRDNLVAGSTCKIAACSRVDSDYDSVGHFVESGQETGNTANLLNLDGGEPESDTANEGAASPLGDAVAAGGANVEEQINQAQRTCKNDGVFLTLRTYSSDGVSHLPTTGYTCNSYVTFSTTNWNTWQTLSVVGVDDNDDEGAFRISEVGFLYESIDWYYNSAGARLLTSHNVAYKPQEHDEAEDTVVDLSMFDTRFGKHINRYPRVAKLLPAAADDDMNAVYASADLLKGADANSLNGDALAATWVDGDIADGVNDHVASDADWDGGHGGIRPFTNAYGGGGAYYGPPATWGAPCHANSGCVRQKAFHKTDANNQVCCCEEPADGALVADFYDRNGPEDIEDTAAFTGAACGDSHSNSHSSAEGHVCGATFDGEQYTVADAATAATAGDAEDILQVQTFQPAEYANRNVQCGAMAIVHDDDTRGVSISRERCEATEGRRFWFDTFQQEPTPMECAMDGSLYSIDAAGANVQPMKITLGLFTRQRVDGNAAEAQADDTGYESGGVRSYKSFGDIITELETEAHAIPTWGTIQGQIADNTFSVDTGFTFESQTTDETDDTTTIACPSKDGDGWTMVDWPDVSYAGMTAPVCPYTIVLDTAPAEGATVVVHLREDYEKTNLQDHELYFYEEASYRAGVTASECLPTLYPGSSWVNGGCFVHNVPLQKENIPVPRGNTDLDVMFTSLDWNVPRRITVIALNDDVDEPTEVRHIDHTVGTCATANHNDHTVSCLEDATYTGIAVAGIDVIVVDDDIADLVVIADDGYTAGGAAASIDEAFIGSYDAAGPKIELTTNYWYQRFERQGPYAEDGISGSNFQGRSVFHGDARSLNWGTATGTYVAAVAGSCADSAAAAVADVTELQCLADNGDPEAAGYGNVWTAPVAACCLTAGAACDADDAVPTGRTDCNTADADRASWPSIDPGNGADHFAGHGQQIFDDGIGGGGLHYMSGTRYGSSYVGAAADGDAAASSVYGTYTPTSFAETWTGNDGGDPVTNAADEAVPDVVVQAAAGVCTDPAEAATKAACVGEWTAPVAAISTASVTGDFDNYVEDTLRASTMGGYVTDQQDPLCLSADPILQDDRCFRTDNKPWSSYDPYWDVYTAGGTSYDGDAASARNVFDACTPVGQPNVVGQSAATFAGCSVGDLAATAGGHTAQPNRGFKGVGPAYTEPEDEWAITVHSRECRGDVLGDELAFWGLAAGQAAEADDAITDTVAAGWVAGDAEAAATRAGGAWTSDGDGETTDDCKYGSFQVRLNSSPGTKHVRKHYVGEPDTVLQEELVYVVITPDVTPQTMFDPVSVTFTHTGGAVEGADTYRWDEPATFKVVPVDDEVDERAGVTIDFTSFSVTQHPDVGDAYWGYTTPYQTAAAVGAMEVPDDAAVTDATGRADAHTPFRHHIRTIHAQDNDYAGVTIESGANTALRDGAVFPAAGLQTDYVNTNSHHQVDLAVTEGESFSYYTLRLDTQPRKVQRQTGTNPNAAAHTNAVGAATRADWRLDGGADGAAGGRVLFQDAGLFSGAGAEADADAQLSPDPAGIYHVQHYGMATGAGTCDWEDGSDVTRPAQCGSVESEARYWVDVTATQTIHLDLAEPKSCPTSTPWGGGRDAHAIEAEHPRFPFNALLTKGAEAGARTGSKPINELTQTAENLDGYLSTCGGWQRDATYRFTADDWDVPQYVYLYAHNDKDSAKSVSGHVDEGGNEGNTGSNGAASAVATTVRHYVETEDTLDNMQTTDDAATEAIEGFVQRNKHGAQYTHGNPERYPFGVVTEHVAGDTGGRTTGHATCTCPDGEACDDGCALSDDGAACTLGSSANCAYQAAGTATTSTSQPLTGVDDMQEAILTEPFGHRVTGYTTYGYTDYQWLYGYYEQAHTWTGVHIGLVPCAAVHMGAGIGHAENDGVGGEQNEGGSNVGNTYTWQYATTDASDTYHTGGADLPGISGDGLTGSSAAADGKGPTLTSAVAATVPEADAYTDFSLGYVDAVTGEYCLDPFNNRKPYTQGTRSDSDTEEATLGDGGHCVPIRRPHTYGAAVDAAALGMRVTDADFVRADPVRTSPGPNAADGGQCRDTTANACAVEKGPTADAAAWSTATPPPPTARAPWPPRAGRTASAASCTTACPSTRRRAAACTLRRTTWWSAWPTTTPSPSRRRPSSTPTATPCPASRPRSTATRTTPRARTSGSSTATARTATPAACPASPAPSAPTSPGPTAPAPPSTTPTRAAPATRAAAASPRPRRTSSATRTSPAMASARAAASAPTATSARTA
jgi:hypothetical protein